MGNKNAKPPEHSKFKKGQSGNPNGAPKKLPELDKLLAEVLGGINDTDENAAKSILNALIAKAKKGDVRAAEVLMDRAYGKAKQEIAIDNGIQLNITRKVVK